MIQHGNQAPDPSAAGDFIEDIRSIRAKIAAQFGNDVDRLCDHLQEIQKEYSAGSGKFAAASIDKLPALMESWGPDAHLTDENSAVTEIREIRRRLAQGNS